MLDSSAVNYPESYTKAGAEEDLGRH